MRRRLTSLIARRPALFGVIGVLALGVVAIQLAGSAAAAPKHHHTQKPRDDQDHGSATGLGQLSGFLPADKLTLPSAIDVNLSNETVRLPIYPGTAPVPGDPSKTETVWYILEDASTSGAADDLGVNYAPKLANMAIGCPACVQTVTEDNPSPQDNPFGPAVINFQGAPDFSPTRIAVPGPTGFPLANFQPGAVAGPGYSPFIRIAGSDIFYSALTNFTAPSTFCMIVICMTTCQ